VERIRVLIVESDRGYRTELRSLLRQHINRLEIVGEADGGDDALYMTGATSPDVVLLDVKLRDVESLPLMRSLRQQYPMTSVILLSAAQDEDELYGAIRYGAAAYVSKDVGADELADVISRVRTGKYLIDDNVLANPALALRVLSSFRELSAMDQRVKPLFVPLSPREIEVLEHAARGATNRNIARSMGISEQTVKNHLGSIMRKLAVNDRTHAVVVALQQGWIQMPEL
jgi:DNA-binding NarL/FixJ family response regulator